MTGDEDRLTRGGPGPCDRQVYRGCCRLAVFVGAKQRHVKTPARELEIVRIAAKRRDRRLWCEDQSYVVVPLVFVQPVLPALVQRDRFAVERCTGLLRLRFAFALEPGECLVPRGNCLRRRHVGNRLRHLRRDVLRSHQHRDLPAGTADLGLACGCGETLRDVIPLRGGEIGQTLRGAMMIREDEAVRGDERAGAAALESHDRLPQLLQPLICDGDLVLARDGVFRDVVEGPHPFVSQEDAAHGERQRENHKPFHGITIPRRPMRWRDG